MLPTYFHAGFLLGLFLHPEDECDVFPETSDDGYISQKTELFTTNYVRI
jgi:hypothetical protein